MKIRIKEILEQTGASCPTTEQFDIEEITVQERTIIFPVQPTIEVVTTNTQDEILVQGEIRGRAIIPCSRCLEPFSWLFNFEFTEIYDKKGPESIDLTKDLDISEEVYQYLVVNIPIKAICSENCQGLCQECGINKNYESCECRLAGVDPRWEKLKRLLEQ